MRPQPGVLGDDGREVRLQGHDFRVWRDRDFRRILALAHADDRETGKEDYRPGNPIAGNHRKHSRELIPIITPRHVAPSRPNRVR